MSTILDHLHISAKLNVTLDESLTSAIDELNLTCDQYDSNPSKYRTELAKILDKER